MLVAKGPSPSLAIALAAAAGCVDAVGYRSLGGALVAHMSGNTLRAATFLATAQLSQALLKLLPVAGFVLGVGLGTVAAELARASRLRRRLALVLSLELALLALALLAWKQPWELMAATLAAAMGVQGAALRRVAGHDVRTTFITGMLVGFVEESVRRLLRHERAGGPKGGLHLAVWLGFFAGAAGGTLWPAPRSALFFPIAVALGIALFDVWYPSHPDG